MNIDHDRRHLPDSIDHYQYGFGQNLIERMNAIRDDLEAHGVQGLLSLIQALIVRGGSSTREALLEQGERICGPGLDDVFAEFLDQFEGTDPHRHMWTETRGGRLHLIKQQ